MKYIFIVCSLILSTALFVGCNRSSKTETKTTVTVYYSCPMHPEVKSDKPGKCPKCGGMDLEKHEE